MVETGQLAGWAAGKLAEKIMVPTSLYAQLAWSEPASVVPAATC